MSQNLSAISIIDHDTVEAYSNIDYIDGLTVIPGVEITTFSPYEIHMLRYFKVLNYNDFQN